MNAQAAASGRNVVAWWWGVIAAVPGALVITSLLIQALWWQDLPTRMPKHWNAAGEPDAFGGRWSATSSTLVIGVAVPALMIAITAPRFVKGVRGWVYRFLAAMSLAMATLGAVLGTGISWLHRGLDSTGPWPNVNGVVALGFGAAVALGGIGYVVQPRQIAPRPVLEPIEPIALSTGELAVWMRDAVMPKRFRWLLMAVGGAMIAATVVFFAIGQTAAALIYVGVLILLVLTVLATAVFHVRVDARGFEVVSALGWPRVTVGMDQVTSAEAVRIDGLSEFGGYGVRMAPGAFGVVLRDGEAIQVERSTGRRIVVTVDDAATGAALLNALKARA